MKPLPRLRWSLRSQLVLWLVGANLLVLGLSVFITDRVVRSALQTEPNWTLLAQAALQAYETGGVTGLNDWSEQQHRRGFDASLYRDGQSLLEHPLPPHLQRFLPQLLGADAPLSVKAGEWLWLGSVPVTTASGEALKLVAARVPRPPHERRGILLSSQLALCVIIISFLGALLARGLTRPIAALQVAARRMADGDLTARTDAATARRTDEIGALARDFNHMAARTETLVAQQRTVLQDVSHELRSPLARLHLLLELARQGGTADSSQQLDRAAKEISRLDTLIGEVLDLSRMEATLPGMATVAVDCAVLVEEVLAEHAVDAEARRLEVRFQASAAAVVLGDASLLARALGNVLGNAFKFSPEGGAVALTVAAQAGEVQLTVRDHGPGISAANFAKLFQPFYRGDNAALADGHGLGLAIARRIVTAHGGRIEATNAAGGGLQVDIVLPMAAA
jgi:signal transduction histidine kinase